jgi:hypothetical protein
VAEIKQVQFFRSLCENLKTRMLTTKVAHCSKTDSTEGGSKHTKMMKCLKVLDEMKWLTGSDICFGCDPIRTLGKVFKMTPGTVQQCIHPLCFVLSSEPTLALKIQSDLKPLLDIVDTLIISMAVCVNVRLEA